LAHKSWARLFDDATGSVLIKSIEMRRTQLARAGTSPALGLLLLSALWAGAWLRTGLIPRSGVSALPPFLGQAIFFCVFAILAGSIGVARRIKFPRGRRAWACAGIGVGLFVVPAVFVMSTEGWISNLDKVAVFSLTPVFAIVLEPYLQGGALRQGNAALAGALAAVAGILLLLPLDVPGSFRAGAALFALLAASFSIAATNCLAVGIATSLAGRSALPMAALAGAASAICSAVVAALTPHAAWQWDALLDELLWRLLIDLPALFLLFWLMRRMVASRMTARFLLAPLFAILAGLAVEPTLPPARGWLGIVLLACGAAWLVFAPAERDEGDELSLVNAHPDT
jgi:drug/metabolite transporter (DMT)-like permease